MPAERACNAFKNCSATTPSSSAVPFAHHDPCPAHVQPAEDSAKGAVRVGIAVLVCLFSHPTTPPLLPPTSPRQPAANLANNILFLKPLLQAEDHTGNCLLTQRASTLRSFPNGWVLPGGGAEAGESLFETGARELFEETGIVADKTSMRVMGLWESTFPHTAITGKPISHHHIVIYLHAKALPSSVLMLQKSEVQTACWLSRKQAQSIFAHYAEPDQLNTSFRAVKPGLSSTEDWDEKVHAEDSPPISLAALADRLTFGTRFALKLWIKLKLAPSNADGDDKIGNL